MAASSHEKAVPRAVPVEGGPKAGRAKGNSENDLCVVCLEAPNTHAMVPCGHQCVCMACSQKIGKTTCPVCREPERGYGIVVRQYPVRVHISYSINRNVHVTRSLITPRPTESPPRRQIYTRPARARRPLVQSLSINVHV